MEESPRHRVPDDSACPAEALSRRDREPSDKQNGRTPHLPPVDGCRRMRRSRSQSERSRSMPPKSASIYLPIAAYIQPTQNASLDIHLRQKASRHFKCRHEYFGAAVRGALLDICPIMSAAAPYSARDFREIHISGHANSSVGIEAALYRFQRFEFICQRPCHLLPAKYGRQVREAPEVTPNIAPDST